MVTRTTTPVNGPTAQAEELTEPTESTTRMANSERDITYRVHVYRDRDSRRVVMDSSHPIPNMRSLSPFLDPVYAQRVRDYGYDYLPVDTVANSGYFATISPKLWQDLLVKEIVSRYTAKVSIDEPEPVEGSVIAPPAFLAVGGNLYELNQVARVKTSGALKAVRARVTAEAKKQAETIVSDAQATANSLISQAQQRLIEAKRKEEEIARSGRVIPPQWAVDGAVPLKTLQYDGVTKWCVGTRLSITFEKLYYKWTAMGAAGYEDRWREWDLNRGLDPIEGLLWIKLDDLQGRYNTSACHLDATMPSLPHIQHTRACMAPDGLPPQVNSTATLKQFGQCVSRCMKVIDYSSPLTVAANWPTRVKAFIPVALHAALCAEDYGTRLTATTSNNPIPPTRHGVIDHNRDASETWTAA